MKKITILGISGSIGQNGLEIINSHKDQYELVAFSVFTNTSIVESLILEHPSVSLVGVKSLDDIHDLILKYPSVVFTDNICMVASYPCDLVLNAISGYAGLKPSLAAIDSFNNVALANKESLVVGGRLLLDKAYKNGVKLIPVDSEHSAIFQCLEKEIDSLIITASGGPFYKYSKDELKNVTLEDALKHPTWVMGKKITIDSATLINKAFEIIEAYYFFNVPIEKIKVLIQPTSLCHSIVTFKDGAMKALISNCSMKLPIAYAFSYPSRLNDVLPTLDLTNVSLEFLKVNEYNEEVLSLAYDTIKKGGNRGVILAASDEMAVNLFIEGKIKFLDIVDYIKKALDYFPNYECQSIEEIDELTQRVKDYIRGLVL